MARQVKRKPAGLLAIGLARPAKPQSVYAEDFSLLYQGGAKRRLRLPRTRIIVLH